MKETNYWQQFMSTGSVKDYLNYCTNCNQNVSGAGNEDSAAGLSNVDSVVGMSSVAKDLGENSYAGVCSSNRNDFKDGACR